MNSYYVYKSLFTLWATRIIYFIIGIIAYACLGTLGTIGIALLLLWISYKLDNSDLKNRYTLYDVVKKKNIMIIQSDHIFTKGDVICPAGEEAYLVEEIDKFVKYFVLDHKEEIKLYSNDKGEPSALLKCRKIKDFTQEEIVIKEQLEFDKE